MKSISKRTLKFIDSWLTLRSQWAHWPGFTVGIAKDGEVVFNKAYGLANIENNEKLTTNHLFHVASQSKIFTATAVMQLQERGKLRIDMGIFPDLTSRSKVEVLAWVQPMALR